LQPRSWQAESSALSARSESKGLALARQHRRKCRNAQGRDPSLAYRPAVVSSPEIFGSSTERFAVASRSNGSSRSPLTASTRARFFRAFP